MLVEVVDLAWFLDRYVRTTHNHQHVWPDSLGQVRELKAEGFIPKIVAQHQYIRPVLLHCIPKTIGISEQSRLDLGQIPIHDSLYVSNTKRHAIVGKHTRIVVAKVRQIYSTRHSRTPRFPSASGQHSPCRANSSPLRVTISQPWRPEGLRRQASPMRRQKIRGTNRWFPAVRPAACSKASTQACGGLF